MHGNPGGKKGTQGGRHADPFVVSCLIPLDASFAGDKNNPIPTGLSKKILYF